MGLECLCCSFAVGIVPFFYGLYIVVVGKVFLTFWRCCRQARPSGSSCHTVTLREQLLAACSSKSTWGHERRRPLATCPRIPSRWKCSRVPLRTDSEFGPTAEAETLAISMTVLAACL